jgi:UDP-glucuronate 4-epimerase
MDLIAVIETACGKKAELAFHPMQPGDVYETHADIDDIARDLGYAPTTPISVGIPRFVAWYRQYRDL